MIYRAFEMNLRKIKVMWSIQALGYLKGKKSCRMTGHMNTEHLGYCKSLQFVFCHINGQARVDSSIQTSHELNNANHPFQPMLWKGLWHSLNTNSQCSENKSPAENGWKTHSTVIILCQSVRSFFLFPPHQKERGAAVIFACGVAGHWGARRGQTHPSTLRAGFLSAASLATPRPSRRHRA